MVGALDSCCIGWNVDNVRLKDVGHSDIVGRCRGGMVGRQAGRSIH